MILDSVRIQNFKKIFDETININPITVLIGSNNSGKTCILQSLHFAVSVLQSIRIIQERTQKPISTLSADQIRYVPTDEIMKLCHNGSIQQKKGIDISLFGRLNEEDDCREFLIQLRRGKNANLSVQYNRNDSFYSSLSDFQNPFSIYVPGLAGVPLREEYRSDAVIISAISRGDANLFLRNVLYRIHISDEKRDFFQEIFSNIFPYISIGVQFRKEQDIHIACYAQIGDYSFPIEMLGTGVLQVLQLVAYVVNYNPSVLLLDEPDSHLHPNNQRQLAKTLTEIAENTNTKIVFATHSRHLLDSFSSYENAGIYWLQDGVVQSGNDTYDANILLDLGALDKGEKVLHGEYDCVFLTEDTDLKNHETLLSCNGFDVSRTMFFSYEGASNAEAAVYIVHFVQRIRPGIPVILHRDRDLAIKSEVSMFWDKYKKFQDAGGYIFITKWSDIEHYFCTPEHLSHIYDIAVDDIKNAVESRIESRSNKYIDSFYKKRVNIQKTLYRHNQESAPSPKDLLPEKGIEFSQCKGKELIKVVRDVIQKDFGKDPHMVTKPSDKIVDENLKNIAHEIWGTS